MGFKTINRRNIDFENYVTTYMDAHPTDTILVGCDSQNIGRNTVYALVVAFYNVGHGAHIIFEKWKEPRGIDTNSRLLNEVWKSVETAEKIKSLGYSIEFIDIDINPDPLYKSNEVFRQAIGLCEGMGYHVRYKHTAPLVTSMADCIVRGYSI